MDVAIRAVLKYSVELTAAMALFIAALFSRHALLALSDNAAWQATVLLSPAVPLWLVFLVIVRQYRRMDEYMRLELLKLLAVCTGVTACLCASYGFARDAFGLPQLSITWAGPLLCACWFIGTFVVLYRDRSLRAACTTS